MSTTSAFDALRAHASRLRDTSIARLLADDPGRAIGLAMRAGPLYLNFARQTYDGAALESLFSMAAERDLHRAYRRLFDGEPVNVTEGRAALHTALRGNHSQAAIAREAFAVAQGVRQHMAALVAGLQASGVTDIVSVGIGGSDLGPRLVADALRDPAGGRFRVHFLSNVDGAAAQRALAPLDPQRTAAILISKTFGTQETLLNGGILRDWLRGSERLFAVSAHPDRAATAFDIAGERVLGMWDWV
ncbi:MAG: glucose-6-phosphate isomerase, partial [Pseudoxanthomonas sp.]|nr:glucose-6-phosphate isomerase [Pseudoxanthomonas sp.]